MFPPHHMQPCHLYHHSIQGIGKYHCDLGCGYCGGPICESCLKSPLSDQTIEDQGSTCGNLDSAQFQSRRQEVQHALCTHGSQEMRHSRKDSSVEILREYFRRIWKYRFCHNHLHQDGALLLYTRSLCVSKINVRLLQYNV